MIETIAIANAYSRIDEDRISIRSNGYPSIQYIEDYIEPTMLEDLSAYSYEERLH